MINYIWAFMVLISVLFASFNAKGPELTDSILIGSKEAISLFLTLAGNLIFWGGMLKIVEKTGLSIKISNIFTPLLRLLFPGLRRDSPSFSLIAQNMIVNFLGLGSAATPLGLAAMKSLEQESTLQKGVATNEMATFVIINTASIQLIPTNLAAIRSHFGSANPFDVLIPIFFVSILSLSAGLILNRILQKRV